MMKKCLFCLVLLAACQLSYGQTTVKELIAEFSKAKGAEYTKVGKVVKGMDCVEVVELNNCSNEVKEKFMNSLSTLKDNDYEMMVKTNDDGEKTRVLKGASNSKMKDEMVVLTAGDGDYTIVRIKGKRAAKELSKLK